MAQKTSAEEKLAKIKVGLAQLEKDLQEIRKILRGEKT